MVYSAKFFGGGALCALAAVVLAVACASSGDGGPAERVAKTTSAFGGQTGAYEVVTHHNDNQRTGVQSHETSFTTANVGNVVWRASANLGTGTTALPQGIYAQPLYARNVFVGGARADAVFVVDGRGEVWAFKPDLTLITGLTNPRVLESGSAWTDTNPAGVVGTPVIDEPHNLMYVVMESYLSRNPDHARFLLHTLGTNTMADVFAPVLVSASIRETNGITNTFVADNQLQRPALLKNGNYLYIAFGAAGNEGLANQHGWVMTYSLGSNGLPSFANAYVTSRVSDTPGAGRIGNVGLWQGGCGPAADSNGNVYVETANGMSNADNDANSVIKLSSAGLKIGAWQAPQSDFLTGGDLDFGSAGPLVIAGPNGNDHIVAAGKQGLFYSMDTSLTNVSTEPGPFDNGYVKVTQNNCTVRLCVPLPPPNNFFGPPSGGPGAVACCPHGCTAAGTYATYDLIQTTNAPMCPKAVEGFESGVWSGSVFWNNPAFPKIFLWGQNDFLSFIPWDPNNNTLSDGEVRIGNVQLLGGPYGDTIGGWSGSLALSWDGSNTASAVIWAKVPSGQDAKGNEKARLYAFSAAAGQVSAPLWSWSDIGMWNNFTYPVVANGGLYVTNAGVFNGVSYGPPQLLLFY